MERLRTQPVPTSMLCCMARTRQDAMKCKPTLMHDAGARGSVSPLTAHQPMAEAWRDMRRGRLVGQRPTPGRGQA